MVEWAKSHSDEADASVYSSELKRQETYHAKIAGMTGGAENAFRIHQELGEAMTRHATVVRVNEGLKDLMGKIGELEARWENINVLDGSDSFNQSFQFVRQLKDMLELAKVLAKGALQRDESRGAHYKPAFDIPLPAKEKIGQASDTEVYHQFVKELEKKNNAAYKPLPAPKSDVNPEFQTYMAKWVEKEKTWNKTTLASYKAGDFPGIEYREVVMTVEPPKPRIYQ